MNLQLKTLQAFIFMLIASWLVSCQEFEPTPEQFDSTELTTPVLKTIKIGQDKFQYERYPDA